MEQKINRFPERKCTICGSDDWWFRQKEPWLPTDSLEPGEWLCGRCHPPADPLTKLKYRVIKGNYKLAKAHKLIEATYNTENRDAALAKYQEAYTKLRVLCNELKDKGATECLYISRGKKLQRCLDDKEFVCTVCPNDYWWQKELLELDRRDNPEVYKE